MKLQHFLYVVFIFLVIFFLGIYWIIPIKVNPMKTPTLDSNFNINKLEKTEMQFYPNMRYPNSNISYRIDQCSLNKQNSVKYAFEILSNKTILSFYPVNSSEEIFITCNEKNKLKGGLFIAGEGGPVNITNLGEITIILTGKVLLIKDSKCEFPNIALHELLHALGFKHSLNPKNIMYNVTKCEQRIGEEIPGEIKRLYSIQV